MNFRSDAYRLIEKLLKKCFLELNLPVNTKYSVIEELNLLHTCIGSIS